MRFLPGQRKEDIPEEDEACSGQGHSAWCLSALPSLCKSTLNMRPCCGLSVKVYPAGSFIFLAVESSGGGAWLEGVSHGGGGS